MNLRPSGYEPDDHSARQHRTWQTGCAGPAELEQRFPDIRTDRIAEPRNRPTVTALAWVMTEPGETVDWLWSKRDRKALCAYPTAEIRASGNPEQLGSGQTVASRPSSCARHTSCVVDVRAELLDQEPPDHLRPRRQIRLHPAQVVQGVDHLPGKSEGDRL